MKTLEELNKIKSNVISEISKILIAREKELLIKYRKQFIGKCFKFRNSHGRERPKWWLYLKILDVVSINFHNQEEPVFKTLQFQTTSAKSIDIEIRDYQYVREGEYIPISNKVYDNAKNKMIKNVKDYLNK